MQCPTCKAENRPGRLYCAACGAALPLLCPACGYSNEPSDRFCGGCGAPLIAAARRAAAVGQPGQPAQPSSVPPSPVPASPASRPAPGAEGLLAEGERRQITVMFCDLADSVALSERLDAEDYRAVIRAFQAGTAMVIANYGGYIAKYLGDGILAYFGWPEAHEDDPERAIRAGLGLVEAVRRLRFPGGIELHVRVGISTGRVVVGDTLGDGAAREQSVSGDIPNRAARLQSVAEPDTVLIGNVTRRLAGGLFEYADLGRLTLKGFSEPMRAWRVLGESSAESRFEALHASPPPLVGRAAEMRRLLDAWEGAAQGAGRVVLIGGEAGLGKSRLLEELRRSLPGERMAVLGFQCSPHHKDSALYPVVAHIERSAGFMRSDDAQSRLGKLEALLRRLSPQPERALPLLSAFLNLPAPDGGQPARDAEGQREAMLGAIVSLIEDQARRQPLLVSFEDAHWMDATTLRLVSLLVPRIRLLPVLIVVTHRPDFVPPWPGAPHVETINLHRLPARDCAAIIANLSGGRALPPSLVLRLVGRSDGVPLFVEELTKAVLASDALNEPPDQPSVAGRVTPFAVPETLQDSLMARLDRDPAAKDLAQVASAIGRQFSHELLTLVSPLSPEETGSVVQRLIRSELLLRRGTPPNATYRFKHALVQDAAYATLLRRRRQRLHARIAEVLEKRFADMVDSEPEVLAHHWAIAGAADKAAACWLRAGERAIARSATAESVAHLRRAADLLATLPETAARLSVELDVQCALGSALIALSGPSAEETGAAFRRARLLSERTGRSDRLLTILYGLGVYHFVRAELAASRRASEELLRTAEAQANLGGQITAHRCLGADLFMQGEFAAARRHFERALALLADETAAAGYAYDSVVVVLGYLSWTELALGRPDRAQALCRRMLTRARRLDHPHSLAYALDSACTLFQLFGIGRHVRQQAGRLLALAEKQDFAFWRAQALMYTAWVGLEGPEPTPALQALRDGLRAHQATGAQVFTPFHQGMLARADIRLCMPEDALPLLDEALATTEATSERWFAAELHRLRAACHALRGDAAAAEAELLRALDIARAQQAAMWALRAATDLARLRAGQGRPAEALAVLEPVCAGFTEGLRTQDFHAARSLLASLGQPTPAASQRRVGGGAHAA